MNSTNEPLITIIVPAYNAQEYISECIDSVLNQTYSQWELLIIDDGSTDQTPAFVDQFVKKDPRIYLYQRFYLNLLFLLIQPLIFLKTLINLL